MLIVYRKSDKKILFNLGKSFVEPQGMSDENGKLAVIERSRCTFDDYDTFRLHNIEDREKVDEILKYKDYVSLIFDKDNIAVNYEIDYEKYEIDKQLREEQELLERLIPSKQEVLMAEVEKAKREIEILIQ
ncbi:hypothetical protein ACF3M2_18710 [Tissierella carlieri]|uniref:hypothetical protein n=1 Tax=Tissierella carlieri TaxID=689904 RepID=UPI00386D1BE4